VKRFLVVAAVLALATSAAYAAPPPGKGKPDKSASSASSSLAQSPSAKSKDNAAKACKKELADLKAQAFADKYGTNANKKNAFGKCVSAKAKENAKAGGKKDDDESKDDDD
jgi:hypothetical protein